jgi:hypothetical protein
MQVSISSRTSVHKVVVVDVGFGGQGTVTENDKALENGKSRYVERIHTAYTRIT